MLTISRIWGGSLRGALRQWAARLAAPGSAVQLASLRIAVAATILLLPEVGHARSFAAVNPALRVAPEGLGWFLAVVPIGPVTATIMQAACVGSALCAIVGLAARPALAVLTLSSFYLLALGQLSGAVWHDMHLLWMAALLASSPCDEVLAFDRQRAGRPPDSARYGVPLFFARLLLACVYFFPGVHKLATSGLAWAISDNLRNQIWWKWAETGVIPTIRIDRYPHVLHAAGLGVIAFELSFPVLALSRAGRGAAAVLGLIFHALAQAVLSIPFASLWLLYVVFIDPERVVGWWRRRSLPSDSSAPSPSTRSARLVGVALFLAVAIQGVRGQTRAFPFACYPTFEWMAGTAIPDLILEAEAIDGTRVVIPLARDARGRRSQRQWGEIWSLAGVTSPVDPARLKAYLDAVGTHESARGPLRDAVRVRFYRAFFSVVPEEAGSPPVRVTFLAAFRLSGATPLDGERDSTTQ